jgi:hypothetical protein
MKDRDQNKLHTLGDIAVFGANHSCVNFQITVPTKQANNHSPSPKPFITEMELQMLQF